MSARSRTRRAAGVLWALAALCLLLWAGAQLRRVWAQSEAAASLAGRDAPVAADAVTTDSREVSAPSPAPIPTPALGEPWGRIQIPRLGLSSVVLAGVADEQLDLAPGHFPETAYPGQGGNVALAGHRDAEFRALAEARAGDRVVVIFRDGKKYHYRVRWTAAVEPDATWVLAPTADERLTLVTCYPFDWVGPAPRRYVVRARRVDS